MICSYCGEFADTYDHVIPVSYKHVDRKMEVGNKEAIPCCSECNTILGNRFLHTVSARAGYLLKTYSKRYQKVLRTPDWDADELAEMGDNMKQSILARLDARDILKERLTHLKDTSLADYTVQECKDKFANMVYKPLHSIRFSKMWRGEKKVHYVYIDEITSTRMLFENSFIEKAIELLESRGVVTDDYKIEVIRAGSS